MPTLYFQNLNIMNSFLFVQFLYFFTILQSITADNSNCSTPPSNTPVLVSIFDNNIKLLTQTEWDKWCSVVKKFPEGTITMEYRPGALATGSESDIKCGSSNCKEDQFWGCKAMVYKNYNSCFETAVIDIIGAVMCYCNNQSVNKWLLENAALRANWKVPEANVPTLVVNKVYDPCIKFDNAADFQAYLCKVLAKKIGPCQ